MFDSDPRYAPDYYDDYNDPLYRPGNYGGVDAINMFTYDPDEQDRARNLGPRETRIAYDPKFDTARQETDVRQRTQEELKESPQVMVSEPNQGSGFLMHLKGAETMAAPITPTEQTQMELTLAQKAKKFYDENRAAVWVVGAIAAYMIWRNQKQIMKFFKK